MESYTAVIIEPRKHPALSFVLQNFLKNLSEKWSIIIIHSNENSIYINNIISNDLINYAKKISKINLFKENITLQEYNKLLTSEYFYNLIPTETFLIFQTDTMLSFKNKDLINDFLHYDYVGAPWRSDSGWVIQGEEVGNGGLSLRKKSVCLDCLKNNKWNESNEDIFFSKIIKNKPTKEKAKEFSVETIYNNITFGIHKPWLYISNYELKLLMTQFDGLDKLMILNNFHDF
jgi:hypothetical protein